MLGWQPKHTIIKNKLFAVCLRKRVSFYEIPCSTNKTGFKFIIEEKIQKTTEFQGNIIKEKSNINKDMRVIRTN